MLNLVLVFKSVLKVWTMHALNSTFWICLYHICCCSTMYIYDMSKEGVYCLLFCYIRGRVAALIDHADIYFNITMPVTKCCHSY